MPAQKAPGHLLPASPLPLHRVALPPRPPLCISTQDWGVWEPWLPDRGTEFPLTTLLPQPARAVGSHLRSDAPGMCADRLPFKYVTYLFLERGEGKEKERERNICMWLPLARPLLGARPGWQPRHVP